MVSSEVEPILLYAFQKKCALHFVATPKLCIYNKYLPQFWCQHFAFYVLQLKKKKNYFTIHVTRVYSGNDVTNFFGILFSNNICVSEKYVTSSEE